MSSVLVDSRPSHRRLQLANSEREIYASPSESSSIGFLQKQTTASLLAQVVESMMGTVDGNVLERIAKIMSYMRPSLPGKAGKRLKRKDKLRMLADGGEAPLNGHLHGSLKPAAPHHAAVKHYTDLCTVWRTFGSLIRQWEDMIGMALSCHALPSALKRKTFIEAHLLSTDLIPHCNAAGDWCRIYAVPITCAMSCRWRSPR